MSINSMTNVAAARRLDVAPLNKVPKTLNEIRRLPTSRRRQAQQAPRVPARP
ncbi:MAG: hypothetical protein IPK16_23535 [Anaerolineales bacterium]|nr:hypothetical protein [Anaerolineales bacterium]